MTLRVSGWHRRFRLIGHGYTSLLSEKVLEGLARVQRLRGGGFTLDCGSQGKVAALVLNVFSWDAGGNRLGTFEAGGRVEERALLATVQFKAALWTASLKVNPDRQD